MDNYFYEYKKKARQNIINYILVIFGFIFVFALSSINPERDCVEYPCHNWMIFSGIGLGALFGLGGVLQLIKNYESGCALDTVQGQIIWWDVFPAQDKYYVSVSDIEHICVDKSYENTRTFIYLKNGTKKVISDHILPWPVEKWVDKVREAFPDLRVEIKN